MGKNERLVREDIWSDVSGKYFTVSARVKTTVDGKMERDEFEGGKHELSRRPSSTQKRLLTQKILSFRRLYSPTYCIEYSNLKYSIFEI